MGRKQGKKQAVKKGKRKAAVFGNNLWVPAVIGMIAIFVIAGGIVLWKWKGQNASKLDYNPAEYVKLGKYVGLQISLAVTEEDIKDEVDTVLEDHITYEQVAGTTESGQKIYADYEGYVDGQRMDVTCGSDYVELGSGDWPEGFEANLIGASTGETKIFTIPVPEGTYGDETVDGKEIEYHVAIQYICGREIKPEYTDEFVQSISKKYKTTEEYTEYLRQKLKKENDEQKEEYAWSEVVQKAKAKKYPKSLLEDAKKEVLQGYYDMALVYGCSREEIFPQFGYESEQDFADTDLKPLAKDTAKEYLVAEAIAAKEGISYTEEQYQKYLEEQYSGMTDKYDTAEAYEEDNKMYLEHQVLMEQVKAWISDRTEYTE